MDVNEDRKLTRINLFSFARPHMRAFHFAWFCFFLSFFAEFTIPPLFPTLKLPKCEDPDGFLCLETCANVAGLCRIEGQSMQLETATEMECTRQGGRWKFALDDTLCEACVPSMCGGLGLTRTQIIISNVVAVSGQSLPSRRQTISSTETVGTATRDSRAPYSLRKHRRRHRPSHFLHHHPLVSFPCLSTDRSVLKY